MVSLRIGRDEGGRRKFMAVVDATPECGRAALYAARRAKASAGGVVLLYVIEPGDMTHWLGVEAIMRAEATAEAGARLARVAEALREAVGIEPEVVTREGAVAEEILGLIEADREIAILVLASGASSDGPGPLVSSIVSKPGAFPIPVTIVPGSLSDEEIDHLC